MDEIQFLTEGQREALIELYIAYFNRAPEAGGLSFHANAVIEDLNAGLSFEQAYNNRADNFFQAALDLNVYSNAMTSNEFVAEVYENALLRPGPGGDAPTEAELSYWTTLLANGEIGRGDLVQRFLSDTENLIENGTPEEQAVATQVMAVLDNRVQVAEVFARPENSGNLTGEAAINAGTAAIAGVDETQASVDAAIEAINEGSVGVDGDVFTLTDVVGEQVVGTSGDDEINAVADANGTFNVGDTIEGNAGEDTFNVFVTAGSTFPAGFDVSEVEIVNVTHAGASGALNLDTAQFAGVEQLWQIDNTNVAGNFQDVTVGAGATAGFRSTGNTNAATATATVTAAAGVTDVAMALDGVFSGSNITLGETTANDLSTVSVSGSVASTGATPPVNALTLTGGAADVDTLNVALESNTDLTLTTLDDLNTFDATGSTGNITVDLSVSADELATANFGAGNDTVTHATAAGTVAGPITFDLGDGNDVFNFTGANATADVTVDITLGAGSDTLAVVDLANISDDADVANDLVTVADFSTEEDVLDLTGLADQVVLNNTQEANIEGAADLDAALDLAASYVQAGNGAATGVAPFNVEDFAVFNFDGNAYVYVSNTDGGSAAFADGDGLIQLTGVNADSFDSSSLLV